MRILRSLGVANLQVGAFLPQGHDISCPYTDKVPAGCRHYKGADLKIGHYKGGEPLTGDAKRRGSFGFLRGEDGLAGGGSG